MCLKNLIKNNDYIGLAKNFLIFMLQEINSVLSKHNKLCLMNNGSKFVWKLLQVGKKSKI